MNLKHLRNLLVIIALCNFSCTPYKNVAYFQNLKNDPRFVEKIVNFYPITVQTGDLLAIHEASLNPQADIVFNNYIQYDEIHPVSSGSTLIRPTENPDAVGYLVDINGNINLPLVGLMHVAGLSTHALSLEIQGKLEKYFSSPVVSVRIQNFKVSVLGDVKEPGSFNVKNERITIIEALSLAGDLTTTGVRTNVILIREEDGNRSYIHLDLTSTEIINSPYYYLKNNDVIYVQPGRSRVESESTFYEKFGIALSVLSIIVFLVRK
jgi:polysaccharide export outer membrane protein